MSLVERVPVPPGIDTVVQQIKQTDMLQNSRETLIRVRRVSFCPSALAPETDDSSVPLQFANSLVLIRRL
jgi:hypothetical protein